MADHREPLWSRILEDLEERMTRGEFDTTFPTDRELVDHYRVSRHTVREAVRRLQARGLVERTPGRGSHRVVGTLEQPLGTIYSLFRSVEDTGAAQTSLVLAQEVARSPEAARVLDLDPESDLFYLERVREAGGSPLAVDRTWLPLDVARPLLGVDFAQTSLYQELRDRCRMVPESGRETIRPVLLDPPMARTLDQEPGTPGFEIDRRTMAGGSPLEWRLTVVSGERFVFRVEWNTPWEEPDTAMVEAGE